MPSRPISSNPAAASGGAGQSPAVTKVLFIALTISASVVILFSVLYFLYHLFHSFKHNPKTLPFDSTSSLNLQRFSYKQLKSATNNFDSGQIIGTGGSGTVFKGVLPDGKSIAIKRLSSISEREFENELRILSGLRSPFLVTLLGYCNENNKRVLVYEYMANKSLQESLFSDGVNGLCWELRFNIVLDVARALEFLHLGCHPPVIHGDIKPSNVLLDIERRAKVSDFGLSRIKVDGEFGVDLFSHDYSGTLEVNNNTSNSNEVDFGIALHASCSSKNSRKLCNDVKDLNLNCLSYSGNVLSEGDGKQGSGKGKEAFLSLDVNGDDLSVGDEGNAKQWGKDWWWRQDGSGGELCSKDYIMEWIGSQIYPTVNLDWDEDSKNDVPEKANCICSVPLENVDGVNGCSEIPESGLENPRTELERKESKTRNNIPEKSNSVCTLSLENVDGANGSSKIPEFGFENPRTELGQKESKTRNNIPEEANCICSVPLEKVDGANGDSKISEFGFENPQTELERKESKTRNNSPEKANCICSVPLENVDGANGDSKITEFEFENPRTELERKESKTRSNKKIKEWWKEENFAEISRKSNKAKNKNVGASTSSKRNKKSLQLRHFGLGKRLYFLQRKRSREQDPNRTPDPNGEFSFRKGWKKKNSKSIGSEMCSGDLFSRELSSTTSMRGTLCYVAPEYGGCGYHLMEKADIYSFGVLILVIVSGRRPLHVLASPMKLEKANLISWCRHLAQCGNVLEVVDERLKEEYNKEEARLCINLALICLQKMPEMRPEIGEIVKILKGEMEIPQIPFEFSPSPPSKLFSRSNRKHKLNAD